MIEYTIIGNFQYKKQEYQALIDDNRRYYFLKINNNQEEYININEYIALINEFKYKEEPLLILNNNKSKKKKLTPKIIIGGILITITLSFVEIMNMMAPRKDFYSHTTDYSNTSSYVVEVSQDEYDKAQKALDELYEYIEKENEDFKVDQKKEGYKLIVIYNNDELDDIFNNHKEDITYDDIIADIKNNPDIPEEFKEIYIELANNQRKQYPTMDLRIWHYNLQTLKIKVVPKMEMQLKAVSGTACAVYRVDENTIYIAEGTKLEKGTWDYQVITHEMGHPERSLLTKIDDKDIRCKFESDSGHGTVVGESMNSLITLRSYDQDEKDIAYQFQSNMIEIMVDEMDNYTYQDFIEHNLTYFEQKLNEYNNTDEAVEMIGLLELQYKDYHRNDFEIDESEFHKLYDYIANMYYRNHLNPDMTREEALKVRDEFIEKLTYDVPEEYNVSIEHLQEYFETYCQSIGLSLDEYTK